MLRAEGECACVAQKPRANCASKSAASHYLVALLRYLLAVGLKRLKQAARGVKLDVHGLNSGR
jgi:hypothetical protein